MGERYGEYELVRKIATGGMAEIFLARLSTSDGFGRPVVVKRMLPQLAVRPDFVTMFLDEARLAANLAHPNVVQVFNLGEVDGSYYMAMELIDGPHLGALFAHSLRMRRPLPIEYCVYSVARAADGLDYAHNLVDPATGLPLSIVHRDISPQNVLVSRHGDVKVTDFGVAKASTQEAKTRTGIIKGKVSYMSPEQCLGEKVDKRTDVFALGIVLYELLTRRRLFRDKSDLLVMQRITTEDVAPPSSMNPGVDAELDEITLKALAKRREDRYSSAADLSEAIDFWLATHGFTGARGGLARWMNEFAPELGLKLDAETSSPGDAPAWLDVPVSSAGKNPPPAPSEAAAEGEGTVSTPALSPHTVSAEGLPDRAADKNTDPDSTVVSPEPPSAVERPEQVGDISTELQDKTDPEAQALARIDDTLRHSPAPGEGQEKRLPMAAMGGGAAALLLAVVGGVFLLGGNDPAAADPPGGPPDPAASDAGGTGDDELQPGGSPRRTTVGPGPGPGPGKVDAGGGPGEEAVEAAVPAGDEVTLEIETDPPGVPLEIGEPGELARSPWSGKVPRTKTLRVKASFNSGAVVRLVALTGDKVHVRIVEKVSAHVVMDPPGAKWKLEGPGLALEGAGTLKKDELLVPGKVYKLDVSAEGYQPTRVELYAGAGVGVSQEVTLDEVETKTPAGGSGRRPSPPRKKKDPPPQGFGLLKVFVRPQAKVKLPGEAAVPAPVLGPGAQGVKVKSGPQRILITSDDGSLKESVKVNITKDKLNTVKLAWEKQPDGSWKRTMKEVSVK